MPGYQYRAPRHPHARFTITPEQEAAIEPELGTIRGPRITDQMVGIPPEPGSGKPEPSPCGTVGGYSAHRRYGEPTCAECRAAMAAWKASRRPSRAKPDSVSDQRAA